MVDLPKNFPHIVGFPHINIACKKAFEEFQKIRERPNINDLIIKKFKKQLHDMVDLF